MERQAGTARKKEERRFSHCEKGVKKKNDSSAQLEDLAKGRIAAAETAEASKNFAASTI